MATTAAARCSRALPTLAEGPAPREGVADVQPLCGEALERLLLLRLRWQDGPTALARLLRGGPAAVAAAWAQWPEAHADGPSRAQAARQRRALEALDIACVPAWSLPEPLRARELALGMVFVRGAPRLLGRRGWAIVGARRAHANACRWAEAAAADLAGAGHLVISGGARGIDAAAHHGALAAGGDTVVYMGSAADEVYPAGNRPLFQRILAAGGALCSEWPPGTPHAGWQHAARNRMIAAHATDVLVVEAATGSGSLSTARWARRLGRRVWVPDPVVGGERAGLDELLRAGDAQQWPGPARVDSSCAPG